MDQIKVHLFRTFKCWYNAQVSRRQRGNNEQKQVKNVTAALIREGYGLGVDKHC